MGSVRSAIGLVSSKELRESWRAVSDQWCGSYSRVTAGATQLSYLPIQAQPHYGVCYFGKGRCLAQLSILMTVHLIRMNRY